MKNLYLLLVIFCFSCNTELSPVPELNVDLNRIESETQQLADSVKILMNGVYSVSEGKDYFGDEVVCKWVSSRWSILAKHDVVYSENAGGIKGDSIILAGYIRIVRSGSGSKVDFTILPNEGAMQLINGKQTSNLILHGITRDGRRITLKRNRDLYVTKFQVIAHRGGGRNTERLGISENSIPMLIHASVLGATGVEIDIKRTRDSELILFHDSTFSPRTVQGAYLLGKVSNFDLSQIRKFGRLIYGETIPTLEEALNAIIDSTLLSLVWLDVKDPSIVERIVKEIQSATEMAKAKNRDVMFLLGVPNQNVLDAYNKSSGFDKINILIEYDKEKAFSYSTCKVWAPMWNSSIPASDILRIHDAGKLVFTWTLDVKNYIDDFLNSRNIDGILSNYPSLVAGMLYSKQ